MSRIPEEPADARIAHVEVEQIDRLLLFPRDADRQIERRNRLAVTLARARNGQREPVVLLEPVLQPAAQQPVGGVRCREFPQLALRKQDPVLLARDRRDLDCLQRLKPTAGAHSAVRNCAPTPACLRTRRTAGASPLRFLPLQARLTQELRARLLRLRLSLLFNLALRNQDDVAALERDVLLQRLAFDDLVIAERQSSSGPCRYRGSR